MKKAVIGTITILFILTLLSCNRHYELVNKKTYNDFLNRLEIGNAYDNMVITSKKILGLLNTYINKNKRKVYGNNEDKYKFDIALIHLYSADFFKSFQLFNNYIKETGDKVRSFYHIGRRLERQNIETGVEVLRRSVIAIGENSKYKLIIGQHRVLLRDLYDYPFQIVDKYLSPEVKETEEYKEANKKYSIAIKNTDTYERRITRLYGFEYLDKRKILEIAANPDITEKEIDFIVQYYIKPYFRDYKKAAYFADKRNQVIRRGNRFTPIIIANMMQAYIGVGRYDDAIKVFELNKENISPDLLELKTSQTHLYLFLSAAYAGKGELDKSLEYLKKELSITKIWKTWLDGNHDPNKLLKRATGKGDMLYSLFLIVFDLGDQFNEFKKAGRYDEVESAVNNAVNRYKDLPVFNVQ